jgi:hypothetical protein
MKSFPVLIPLTVAALALLAPRTAVSAEGGLRVGVAEVDITPPKRFPMAGYYDARQASGTHDPLKARAIVLGDDRQHAALVACDLIGIAADFTAAVRRQASERSGIPAANIILTATHAHTGPDYARDLYEYLRAADKNAIHSKETYAAHLIEAIVEALATARARAEPVLIDAGSARQETPISFNRRSVMRDGSVRTWMKSYDLQFVRAAGPIDPEVGLVLVRSAAKGQPRCLLSNFALHLDTVGGTLWSADYPYYIEQAVQQTLGRDVVSVFGAGCCGDINHVDPSRKEVNKTDFIGRSLARTIGGELPKLHRSEQPALRLRHATVAVPLQEITAEQAARARPLLLEARAGKKAEFFDLVNAYKTVVVDQFRNKTPQSNPADVISGGLCRTWAGVGDRLPVEVDVMALGKDVALVFLPGEVFVELGLAIKQASPFRTTLVIELSNCKETLYIPTRVAYAGGGYEVVNSALQPGSGEMLAEAAVRLLRDIAGEAEKTEGDAVPGRK